MAITINGSGTVTGITAGGLPDGVITTDDLAANAVTTAKLGTDEASGLCKAWVNFDGTSTVAIRAAYNVSSITDNGTGDYTVNFTTAMSDANYAVAGCSSAGNDSTVRAVQENTGSARSTTALRVETTNYVSVEDASSVSISIFR